MKKTIYFILSIFLCSCAGNPPAWWNPSGRYTTNTATEAQYSSTTAQPVLKRATATPVPPTEQTFTPEETSFEEMDLKPENAESFENAIDVLQPSVLND